MSNWRFFKYKHWNPEENSSWPLLITNESGGNYFKIDGKQYSARTINVGLSVSIAYENSNDYLELSLKEAVQLINPAARQKVFSQFGLNSGLNKLIDLTNAEKNRILNKLKSKRAFNADSAYQFKVDRKDEHLEDIFYTMVDRKLIGKIYVKSTAREAYFLLDK